MSINPSNLVQGPAILWFGAFGAVEPLDTAIGTAPNPAVWTDSGATQGGVTWELDDTMEDQVVDQVPMPVGARLTKRALTVTAKLAEASLNNLALAMNHAVTQGSGTGYATLDPVETTSATQPTYTALIVDGWAPLLSSGAAARRRLIVRKTLSQPKIQLAYAMSGNGVYDVTWTGYYVSSSIVAFHTVDQTA